uniref:Uncharacterized protein n=1 Tax=Arundo donax TaxID=35708 RepID=A0A0A9BN85_ARUDO
MTTTLMIVLSLSSGQLVPRCHILFPVFFHTPLGRL